MENLEGNKKELDKNLEWVKTKKLDLMTLLAELGILYLSNEEITPSKEQLDKFSAEMNILRGVVFNA